MKVVVAFSVKKSFHTSPTQHIKLKGFFIPTLPGIFSEKRFFTPAPPKMLS